MPLKPHLVDLRQHPLCERPMRLLLSLERARPGNTFLIMNDRDPDPLLEELKPVLEKRFTYWSAETGPEIWRTFICCEEPIRVPQNQEAMMRMTRGDPFRESSLKSFTGEVRSLWKDGSDPELPFKVKGLMETLLTRASPKELWIEKLIKEGLPARDLYRDKDCGFIVTGHLHAKGHTSVPHDHGASWVLYGVYHGVTEITTYRRTDKGGAGARALLDKKDFNRLTPGAVFPYLPGDIHSVFVTEPSVVLRFLSADLGKTNRRRYICDGVGFRMETTG